MKLLISVIDPYEQQEGDLDPIPTRETNVYPHPIFTTAHRKADGGKDRGEVLLGVHDSHIVGSVTNSPYRELGLQNGMASLTPKEEEAAIKRFKVTLREISSQLETGKSTGFVPSITHTPVSENLMQEMERTLTAVLTSLTSMDALAQCILLVNCFESTGKLNNLECSRFDVALSVAFSVEFHRSLYQLMRSAISRSKRIWESSIAFADSEIQIRLNLLSAYQSLLELNKGSARSESNGEMNTVEALLVRESIALMCKQSSSKAEALCWLQRSLLGKKMCIQTEIAGKNLPSSGYVLPFSVYRALHRTTVENGTTFRPESADDDIVMAAGVSLASGLSYLLGVLTDPSSGKVIVNDMDCLLALQNITVKPSSQSIQSLSISASIAAYVTQFLVTPLLGASGSADIFGLQSFCLSLETSSLSVPQAFRSLLPCAVMYLQGCSMEEIVGSILLRDISSSPLQR